MTEPRYEYAVMDKWGDVEEWMIYPSLSEAERQVFDCECCADGEKVVRRIVGEWEEVTK